MNRIDDLKKQGYDLGALDQAFGFLLHAAWRDAARSFAEHFSDTGYTPQGFSILILIDRNPGCTPGDLSTIMGITPNNMAKLVDHVVSQGVVERHISETDRRGRTLHITSTGKKVLRDLQGRYHVHQNELNNRIGEENIKTINRILRDFG